LTAIAEPDHVNKSLLDFDVESLVGADQDKLSPDPDMTTISVDVMAVTGGAATTISNNAHIFYDSEVLAIIYRSKSRSSGLVSTQVWGWRGKRSQIGEREERKLEELARRYGTALVSGYSNICIWALSQPNIQENVYQHSEPTSLLHALGGTLAIRQVNREHTFSVLLSLQLLPSPGTSAPLVTGKYCYAPGSILRWLHIY
jgi:hypothetical protein